MIFLRKKIMVFIAMNYEYACDYSVNVYVFIHICDIVGYCLVEEIYARVHRLCISVLPLKIQ